MRSNEVRNRRVRENRAARLESEAAGRVHVVEGIKHGDHGYGYWSCRCETCRTAHNAASYRRWRQKQGIEGPGPERRGGIVRRQKTSRGGEVSDVQMRALKFIRSYIADYGRAPALRDIADAMGCHVMSASYRVRELEAAGLITYEPRKFRSIRLVRQ